MLLLGHREEPGGVHALLGSVQGERGCHSCARAPVGRGECVLEDRLLSPFLNYTHHSGKDRQTSCWFPSIYCGED